MAQAPFLVRFGATVGAATLGGLLATTVSALRMSTEGGIDVARAWLTLTGLVLLPMLVVIPITRLARDGLRGFLRADGSRALERVAAAAVFACTWLWVLSALGAMLREKTHQRALGAVTFAITAIVTMGFLAFVARRLATILATLRERRRATGTFASSAAIVLSLALLGLRVAHAAPDLTFEGRATLVDGLALALAVAFAAQKTFDEGRSLSRIGPPAAVCMFVVCVHTLVTSTGAMAAMEHASPVYFALLRVFARIG
jgi:hypothetical protein